MEDPSDRRPSYTKLTKRPAVDISFNDITYTAGNNKILQGISGQMKAGNLSAMMGPSGAGKSTLMNILAGYVSNGVTGSIYTNGEVRNLKIFHKLSTYIMQDDLLEPFLTVREAMMVATQLKLGSQVSNHDKSLVVDDVLATLGLSKCIDTFMDKLSGGQRKRVSIALELVNNPPILFLDEPTTGLDVVTTGQLISFLKVLASQGRTIVCTIHQPTASIFEAFDSVYFLASGRCIYQGSPTQLVPFLKEANIECPSTYSPSDFILEIINNETLHLFSDMIQSGKISKTDLNRSRCQSQKSLLYKKESLEQLPPKMANNIELEFPTTFWEQFTLLLSIMYVQKRRNKAALWLQLIHHILSSLVVGSIFYGVGNDASRPVENFKFCLCVCVFYMYTHCMTPVVQFPKDMKIMKREFFNRWYSLDAFYMAKSLSSVPGIVFLGWIFVIVTYLMTDQPMEWKRIIWFTVICSFLAVTSESFGMIIGFICSCTNGSVICPMLMAPMLVLTVQGLGYGQSIHHVMVWIMSLSYVRFGVVGLVTSLYLDGRKMECDEKDIYCFYKDPKILVRDLAMEGHQPSTELLGLIFYFFFFRLVAYISLRMRVSQEFSTNLQAYTNKFMKANS